MNFAVHSFGGDLILFARVCLSETVLLVLLANCY